MSESSVYGLIGYAMGTKLRNYGRKGILPAKAKAYLYGVQSDSGSIAASLASDTGYTRYNGAVLPPLPEWDESVYKHAYINRRSNGTCSFLVTTKAIQYGLYAIDSIVYEEAHLMIDAGGTEKGIMWVLSDGSWGSGSQSTWNYSTATIPTAVTINGTIIWSNTDIPNIDTNEIYLPATEPLPLASPDPIATVYGDTKLTTLLPEYDTAAYPYLFVYYNTYSSNVYGWAVASQSPAYVYAGSGNWDVIGWAGIPALRIRYERGAWKEWYESETYENIALSSASDHVVANYDVYKGDSVYFSASTSVPVYAMISLGGPTAFAVYSEDDQSFTFYNNEDYMNVWRSSRGNTGYQYRGKTVSGIYSGFIDTKYGEDTIPWRNIIDKVVKVSFAEKVKPKYTSNWFSGFSSVTSFDFTNLDTSETVAMNHMFRNCTKITSLNVSKFNTSNVTDMAAMFYGFTSLTSLNLSNFNTSKVTNMWDMFRGSTGLVSLNISSFDTSNVEYFNSMFYNLSSLTSLDVSHFNTSKALFMEGMFNNCSKLTTLDVSNFDTSNVTSFQAMFRGCSGLTSINLSNFDTSKVERFDRMFNNCSGLTSLDVTKFDTSNAINMEYMFYGCSGLTSLDVTKFNTSRVDNMGSMFYGCSKLTSLSLSNFDTSNVTSMSWMFQNCGGLTTLNLSNFVTSNVTYMQGMFSSCSKLTSLNISSFDTSNVEYMNSMFQYCSAFTSLNLSNFNTSNVINMSRMFFGCTGITSLNLSNFDTSNVTDMSYMFRDCYALTTLNISNFNTSNVTVMNDMFECCYVLKSIDVTKFDTSNVTRIDWMFNQCKAITSLDLSSFDTSKVTNMRYMFQSCVELKTIYVSDLWTIDSVAVTNAQMFNGSTKLVGGNGTTYTAANCTVAHACADTASTPGYFTYKSAAFAVYSADDNSLIFYNNRKDYDSISVGSTYKGKTVTGLYKGFDTAAYTSASEVPWYSIAKSVASVSFTKALRPKSLYRWFYEFRTATNIDLTNLDTRYVTDMRFTFYYCQAITELDVSGFDTRNVTNMRGMFQRCDALTNLDLSNFDTGKVTDMTSMFVGSAIATLDLSGFNTSNVTSMYGMFASIDVETLDLSSFDTSKVTDMDGMFSYCKNLRSIYVGDLWSTAAVTTSVGMFDNMASLVGGNGTVYNENNNTHAYACVDTASTPGYLTYRPAAFAIYSADDNSLIFYNNKNGDYANLVVGNSYNDKTVTNIYTGFDVTTYGSASAVPWYSMRASIKTIFVASTVQPVSTKYWFYYFQALTSANFAKLDTSRVTSTYYMFYYCSTITSLDVSSFDMSSVTSMNYMFAYCKALKTLNISGFDTRRVTNMYGMFSYCQALTEVDLSFDTSKVTSMGYMFNHCSKLTSLNLSYFNTAKVVNMNYMFYNCSALKTIYTYNSYSVSQVTNSNNMFYGCTSLVGGISYSSSKVTASYAYASSSGYFTYKDPAA